MLFFLLCPVEDISATVAPIGVKFSTMVHVGPGSPLLGAVPPGDRKNPNFWPSESQCLEHGKSQRYMSITAEHQLDEGFLKYNSPGGSPPPLRGVHYKQKYVAFLNIFCIIIYDKREITAAW